MHLFIRDSRDGDTQSESTRIMSLVQPAQSMIQVHYQYCHDLLAVGLRAAQCSGVHFLEWNVHGLVVGKQLCRSI